MSRMMTITAVALVWHGGLVAAAKPDPFAQGAVWEGTRVIGEKTTQDWSLKVTRRERGHFWAKVTLSTPAGPWTFDVIGNAGDESSGGVRFWSEQKGKFNQSFEGELIAGEVQFTFKGTAFNGKAVSGTATLKSEARRIVDRHNQEYKARCALWDRQVAAVAFDDLAAWVAALPRDTNEERQKFWHCREILGREQVKRWEKEVVGLDFNQLHARMTRLPRVTLEDCAKYQVYRQALVVAMNIITPDRTAVAAPVPLTREERAQLEREHREWEKEREAEQRRAAREKQFEDQQRVQREQERIERQRQQNR